MPDMLWQSWSSPHGLITVPNERLNLMLDFHFPCFQVFQCPDYVTHSVVFERLGLSVCVCVYVCVCRRGCVCVRE